jgi:hypothetical protein
MGVQSVRQRLQCKTCGGNPCDKDIDGDIRCMLCGRIIVEGDMAFEYVDGKKIYYHEARFSANRKVYYPVRHER